MPKKKRKNPRKCAVLFCCTANSDSDEDFQEIDDSLTTGSVIKKQPKETSPCQILPGKKIATRDIVTKPRPSKEDIKSGLNTPNQHGEHESSAKPQIKQGKNNILSSSAEASIGEMPHNVETLKIISHLQKSSKPRKKKMKDDVGPLNNPKTSDRCAKNDGIQPISIRDTETTESSSNVHKLRIKNLMDDFISTFTIGANRDKAIEDIVDKTDVTDNGDQYYRFPVEHSVKVKSISLKDEEDNVIFPKGHNAMFTGAQEPSTQTQNLNLNGIDTDPIDESKPHGNDCNGSEVKTTVSCKVKDEAYNNSEDKFSDIRFAEGRSARPEDTEKIPFNVHGITNNVDQFVASCDDKAEVDPRSSFSAECSGDSSSPSCDALPDDSQVDSSSEDKPSLANKTLKANTQRCVGPKEDPPVPKVPMPPNQPPTSDRRTIRRASKPRVVTEDEEETAPASSTRERSSSPPARPSDLRGELLQSPTMKFSYESSDIKSLDSSHQESRASKSEGSTKERSSSGSPADMRPSDPNEEMIDSPSLKLTSTIGERREEELPVLPEPCIKKNTFGERSSVPNLFGKNPYLEEKLPNRLGSCSLVLGAIGSQNTPEKDPPTKQFHPSPRRLDFTKHLLFSTNPDKGRLGESSSEESIQEKGLDELLKPESTINKKYSRLSQSVFPTSPAIQIKQVDTKPAWSFYNKDFSSKPASTSGFRKEIRPKPVVAAAAPRTRDLPPPQPREFLLAPSLFGRKPGKDLPPVVGRGPSPGQALHPSSQKSTSNFQPIPSTSPTLHPSSKPFLSSTKPFSTCHNQTNPSLLPFHQESCSYPSHISSLEPNAIADYEEELYPHTMPFHDHLRSPKLGFMPTFEEDLPPGHFIPSQNSLPNHRYQLGFSPSGFDDDHSPRPHFQKPMNMRFNSNRGGLLKREQSRRH